MTYDSTIGFWLVMAICVAMNINDRFAVDIIDNGRDKRVMRKKRPTTLVEPDNAEQTIDQEQTAIFAVSNTISIP